MTYYCCSYVNEKKATVSLYLPGKEDFIKAVNEARRQGFNPVRSVVMVNGESVRKERLLK